MTRESIYKVALEAILLFGRSGCSRAAMKSARLIAETALRQGRDMPIATCEASALAILDRAS